MGFLVPTGAVEPVAVLRQTCEVADAEIAGARGPVLVVGGGLAQIVVAGPHKLTDDVGGIVLPHPVVVGQIAPRAVLDIVAGALAVGIEDGLGIVGGCPRGVLRIVGDLDGELIDTARGDGRGGLGAEQETLRQLLDVLGIFMHAVVEAGHVHHLGEAVGEGVLSAVHALGDGARGVEQVADVL